MGNGLVLSEVVLPTGGNDGVVDEVSNDIRIGYYNEELIAYPNREQGPEFLGPSRQYKFWVFARERIPQERTGWDMISLVIEKIMVNEVRNDRVYGSHDQRNSRELGDMN